jgi:hypothetical protein
MPAPLRRSLLPLCILALAVPAGAAAAPVAPPGDAGGSYAATARAAADAGCRSSNLIEFDQVQTLPTPRWAVRHAGRIRCEVPIRSVCWAALYKRDVKISEISNTGRNRCRVGTDFFGSHPGGIAFTQRYSYRLTLRDRDQRWAGTSAFCPERRNERRTLICRDSHTTTSPQRSVDVHSG